MRPSFECSDAHPHKRIVPTGGPGAGKTAMLELVRQHFCEHVHVIRESAGVVFGGGFPRATRGPGLKAAQRAIFYVSALRQTSPEQTPNGQRRRGRQDSPVRLRLQHVRERVADVLALEHTPAGQQLDLQEDQSAFF
jgi:hypothetical protein